jgi:hypothetical protein
MVASHLGVATDARELRRALPVFADGLDLRRRGRLVRAGKDLAAAVLGLSRCGHAVRYCSKQ